MLVEAVAATLQMNHDDDDDPLLYWVVCVRVGRNGEIKFSK